MPVQDIVQSARQSMSKAVEHHQQALSKVRTGRASASMFDPVRVDYYGTPTPVAQVSSISVPEPRMIIIQPWERNLIGAIEKAILAANLGLTPQSDGTVIRVPIPPMTEERRKEIAKQCWKAAEDAKVTVRSVRRDMMELLKKSEKSEGYSEDDRKRGEEEIQKLTDKHVKDIDTVTQAKEHEVMSE